jgi:hypothetical protein
MANKSSEGDRRLVMAEWVTGVMGLFWAVWWSYFMTLVLASHRTSIPFDLSGVVPSTVIPITRSVYLLLSVVIVSEFVIAYVRWLWNIKSDLSNRFLFTFSMEFIFAIVALLAMVKMAEFGFKIHSDLSLYGIALTVAWIFSASFVVRRR